MKREIGLRKLKTEEAKIKTSLTEFKIENLVIICEGKHTYPSRTRSLSSQQPMVVPPRWGARVGRCQSMREEVERFPPSLFVAMERRVC